MTWGSPWAWTLAAAVALPLVAHLWSRRQPRSVDFPTLHFLRATSPISRRLRTLHDWPLLAWRMLIVLAIAAAAAGPTIHSAVMRRTPAPLHRVIVVDDAVRADAASIVQRLRTESASVTVMDDGPVASVLPDAIARASASARRSRSELVVVWDGARAALHPRDLAAVPAFVGVRLEPLTRPSAAPVLASAASLIEVADVPPGDEALRAALVMSLRDVRLPPTNTPVSLRWTDAATEPTASPRPSPVPPRVAQAMADLADDVRVRDAAMRSRPISPAAPASMGHAELLSTRAETGRWLIDSHAAPMSPLTWWAAVAPLESLVQWERLTSPVDVWTSEDVRRATRAAGDAETDVAPRGEHTRAAWGLALALLLVEQWWRGRTTMSGARDAA